MLEILAGFGAGMAIILILVGVISVTMWLLER